MENETKDEIISPGDRLRLMLDELRWTQADLANILGRHDTMVSEIVTGRRMVSPEIARGLASALGTTAGYWLNLESTFHLSKLKVAGDDHISRRARLYAVAPINEMVKRGWIEASNNPDVLEAQLIRFFESKSLDEIAIPSHSARKSTSYQADVTPAQRAWIIRSKQLGRAVHAEKFDNNNVVDAIRRLRPLLEEPREVGQVPRILSELGIRLVIVQPLSGSKMDGACIWVGDSPIIALSIRYDRVDNFWFNLFHELRHAFKGDGSVDSEMELSHGQLPPEEKDANEFAQRNLIRSESLEDFVLRKSPIYSTADILSFAATQRIHPGILVGQLQRRRELDYNKHRKFLEPVKEYITLTAMTDGWGVSVPILH